MSTKTKFLSLFIVAVSLCMFVSFISTPTVHASTLRTSTSQHSTSSHTLIGSIQSLSHQCTYQVNIGTAYMKTLHGTCDAERYILPNTACGQSASQYTTFTANGDTLKTAIFYTRSSANCNNLFIGGAEEGIFGGSNPVTWYGFTYYNQFTYATCFYLNGAYGQYLPIYPNITVPVGHTPIFTNYNGVGCTGSAYGHSTPALN